jgi:hypothetical protein
MLNRQFREYQKSVIDKLKNLHKSDSKAYWSFFNKCDTKGNNAVNKIAIDVLHDHFKYYIIYSININIIYI